MSKARAGRGRSRWLRKAAAATSCAPGAIGSAHEIAASFSHGSGSGASASRAGLVALAAECWATFSDNVGLD